MNDELRQALTIIENLAPYAARVNNSRANQIYNDAKNFLDAHK